jgi:plastocyanin
MIRKALLGLITLTIALAVVASGNARPLKDSFGLKGEVYSNFKIEMKNSSGRPLTSVTAGTYRIKIEDKSSAHNFHLTGPGVNKTTSVGGVSETIWTVTLKPGTYTFRCDAHANQMRGTFRVNG